MKTTKAYDLAPIVKVMEQAMSDLNQLTMMPDIKIVRSKLFAYALPPFTTIKKIVKKQYGFMAIVNFPGIYVEPPIHWTVKWINHETHDICVTISFADFEFYFCADEVGISK